MYGAPYSHWKQSALLTHKAPGPALERHMGRGRTHRNLYETAGPDVDRIHQPQPQHSPGAREPYPTAPLNADGIEAFDRLAAHFPIIQAVTQHETAAVHAAQLAHQAAAGSLTDLDADDLAHAEDLMAGARAVLANAGRLDLIGAGA